jgi:penicillin-binding protein 2
VPNLTPGDLLQTSIGQGLMAASPIQMAVGYAAVANGGKVLRPHVVQTIYAPGVPNSTEPAMADLSRGTVIEEVAPEVRRQVPMPDEVRDPIVAGLRQNITGPGANGRSTTAEELFFDYPAAAIQIAGKTGTAQGRGQYPWNDSSAFASFSLDPERPYTIVSYLEKAGYGSTGAAPAVKCMYLALSGLPVEQGGVVVDPVAISDPLDLTSTVPAMDPPEVYVNDCMRSKNPGTVRPD